MEKVEPGSFQKLPELPEEYKKIIKERKEDNSPHKEILERMDNEITCLSLKVNSMQQTLDEIKELLKK